MSPLRAGATVGPGPVGALALVAACWAGGCAGPPTPVAVRPFALDRTDLLLLVTGSTDGRIELCDCGPVQPDGLMRRGGLIVSYRAAFERTFLLDSGDVFWVEPDSPRSRHVLKGYRRLGYDAVVLGDQEWAAGEATLAEALKGGRTAYLSTNVRPRQGGEELPLVDIVSRQWNGRGLAVLSCVPPDAFRFVPEAAERVTILPVDPLAERVAALKSQGVTVVLVAHGGSLGSAAGDYAETLARDLEPDLIVQGHTSRPDAKVRRVGGTWLVTVGGPGHVGAAAMQVTDSGRIEALEFRLEPVDERWPVDKRVAGLYAEYARARARGK